MLSIEIVLSALLFILSWIFVIIAEKSRNLFGVIHNVFFIVFVFLIHFLQTLSQDSNSFSIDDYLATYSIFFIYLSIFSLGLFIIPPATGNSRRLLSYMLNFPERWLIVSFLAWFLFKGYLLSIYGISAFYGISNVAGKEGITHFSWWVTPAQQYLTSFALGASIIYIAKSVFLKQYWTHILLTILFLLFNMIIAGTHEAPMGPRRLLLILVLITIGMMAIKSHHTFTRFLILNFGKALLIAGITIGLSAYYQEIRTNYRNPIIIEKLRSSEVTDIAKGVFLFLMPTPSDDYRDNDMVFLRGGPFLFLYQIIQQREELGHGTDGELTVNAIKMSIPSIISGPDKTDRNSDDIISSIMSIYSGPYSIQADFSTNLPAIFYADYGLIGIFLSAPLPLLVLFIFSLIPGRMAKQLPFIFLYLISGLVTISASAESGIVMFIVTARNLLILIVIAPLISMIFRLLQRKRKNVTLQSPKLTPK